MHTDQALDTFGLMTSVAVVVKRHSAAVHTDRGVHTTADTVKMYPYHVVVDRQLLVTGVQFHTVAAVD